ncbi:MAG: hypothetical protein JWM44_2525 [Bacilli bacterium]|nr:hypothetical protein [Bacilli bacterium]
MEPIKIGGNCFVDVIATVSHYFQKDYELMFAHSLNFAFDSENKNNTVGSRIRIDFRTYFSLLEKFHGYHLQIYHKQSLEEGLIIIRDQLKKGRPVGIYNDAYFTPGDPKYLQIHSFIHIMLVVGIDEDTNDLYCTDPFFGKKEFVLSYDLLKQGYYGCLTFNYIDNGIRDRDLICTNLCNQLREYVDTKDTLNAMLAFSKEIPSINYLEEGKGFTNFGESQLFIKLGNLTYNRANFALMLLYLDKVYNISGLSYVADQMNQLANSWAIIRGFITKMNILSRTQSHLKMMDDVMGKIATNAYREEQLLEQLLEILSHVDLMSELNPILNQQHHLSDSIDGPIVPLKINHLFNCKGFENDKNTADFDAEGFYFSNEFLTDQRALNIADMSFEFSPKLYPNHDNISCLEQQIEVGEDLYKGIMFLGCCELGSYKDKITLTFEDNSTEEIVLGFSDWWTYFPVNNEIVAMKYNVIQRGRGKLTHEVHLYAQKSSLLTHKKLKQIRLPFVPNIHIFAISLWK